MNKHQPAATRQTTRNELLELLSDDRRRLTLSLLVDQQTPLETGTIAETIAAVDADSGNPPADDAVEQVAIALSHVHLPKLEAAGLLTYDRENALVAGDPDLSAALPLSETDGRTTSHCAACGTEQRVIVFSDQCLYCGAGALEPTAT